MLRGRYGIGWLIMAWLALAAMLLFFTFGGLWLASALPA